jgi:REP-associated tyrosine transposase
MSRLRRIEARDRFFFVTSNLGRGVTPLMPAERNLLLTILSEQRNRGDFFLFGYVLMPSHVHLLFSPHAKDLTRIIRDFKSRTGYEIAQARGVRGPVWQERYFDNFIRRVRDFWEKLEYIHRNPVEAGLVSRPEDWQSSSYRHYIQKGEPPIVPDKIELPAEECQFLWPAPWR